MFLFLIGVITVLLVFVFWKNKEKEQFWKHILKIPGPKAYPIVGTEYHFYTPEKIFLHDRELAKQFYPIYARYTVGLGSINLMTPEDIELVLNNSKHLEKSSFYEFLKDWLGTGLLTSKGQHWHKRRKILTPAFHFSILQEFVDIFNKEVNYLVKELKEKCDQPYIDVVKPITEFTLYSIGETSLGKDLREDPKCTEYKQAVYDFGEQFVYRTVRPWLHFPLVYQLSPIKCEIAKTCETLHDFSNNIVRERLTFTSQNGKSSSSERKRLALLDLMLKAKENGADIDEVGIREEVDTFILGGHDTTAVSLSHSLMLIANEQEIQEEMYQEIISVVENPNNPTFAELGELKYVERCIKESLRMYPSAAIISRLVGEDIKLKTGYVAPKDSVAVLQIYDLHRSKEIYENPDKFDPDRFLPENIAKRHPYAYIPFSAGSRNCIGQKYAMLEMKVALCAILANFKLDPVTKPSDLKHKADIVLRPACEIRVKFIPRS